MDVQYWECKFIDGSFDTFKGKCNVIREFGSGDMLEFRTKNGENYITLAIIPKAVIRAVINHYKDSDMDKIQG